MSDIETQRGHIYLWPDKEEAECGPAGHSNKATQAGNALDRMWAL